MQGARPRPLPELHVNNQVAVRTSRKRVKEIFMKNHVGSIRLALSRGLTLCLAVLVLAAINGWQAQAVPAQLTIANAEVTFPNNAPYQLVITGQNFGAAQATAQLKLL